MHLLPYTYYGSCLHISIQEDHENLLIRPKDIQDNATPSGNALAASALLQIATYGDRSEWQKLAEDMLIPMLETTVQYPTAFAKWLYAADFALGPTREIAIVEKPNHSLVDILWSEYRPRLVAAILDYPPDKHAPALLNDRPLKENFPTAYVCQNFICKQPVNDPKELAAQLSSFTTNPLP
jgi:uncharacterized protein YyaL (SSP411 family)